MSDVSKIFVRVDLVSIMAMEGGGGGAITILEGGFSIYRIFLCVMWK